MSIDQFIALAASIGACMAAIATFLTVLQISKQRRATYRPELALSRVVFEGSTGPGQNNKMPSFWMRKEEGNAPRTELVPNLDFASFAVPLANIGLGAAKNVLVTWTFALNDLVEELNKRAQRTLTPAYFTIKNGTFSAKSEKLGNWASIWQNQQKDNIDYILPASIQRDTFMLRLPHAYVAGVSSLLALSFGEANESFPAIPRLIVRFEYLDIADDKHESVFEIDFNLVAFGNGGEFIHGYLEFHKRAKAP
jgi:hypothetical protein